MFEIYERAGQFSRNGTKHHILNLIIFGISFGYYVSFAMASTTSVTLLYLILALLLFNAQLTFYPKPIINYKNDKKALLDAINFNKPIFKVKPLQKIYYWIAPVLSTTSIVLCIIIPPTNATILSGKELDILEILFKDLNLSFSNSFSIWNIIACAVSWVALILSFFWNKPYHYSDLNLVRPMRSSVLKCVLSFVMVSSIIVFMSIRAYDLFRLSAYLCVIVVVVIFALGAHYHPERILDKNRSRWLRYIYVTNWTCWFGLVVIY